MKKIQKLYIKNKTKFFKKIKYNKKQVLVFINKKREYNNSLFLFKIILK